MPNNGTQIYSQTIDGVKYGVDVETDVYKVLGLARQSGGYDVGYACSNEHGKTDPWAKFKPVRGGGPATTDTTWKADGKCGFSIPEYSAPGGRTSGLIEALISGEANWVYLAPRTGTDWCRIADFDGYNHRAGNPFVVVAPGTIMKQQNGRVRVPLIHEPLQANGNLQPEDFTVRSMSLTQYYLGVVLWNDAHIYYVISSTAGLNEMTLELPNVASGAYKAAPFLSSVAPLAGEVLVGVYVAAGVIAPAEVTVTDYVPELEATVSGSMTYGGRVVAFIVTLYNRYPSDYTYRDISVDVATVDDLGGYRSVGSMGILDTTVEGGGTKTVRGEVNITAPILGPTDTPPAYYIRVSWSGGASEYTMVATTAPNV